MKLSARSRSQANERLEDAAKRSRGGRKLTLASVALSMNKNVAVFDRLVNKILRDTSCFFQSGAPSIFQIRFASSSAGTFFKHEKCQMRFIRITHSIKSKRLERCHCRNMPRSWQKFMMASLAATGINPNNHGFIKVVIW